MQHWKLPCHFTTAYKFRQRIWKDRSYNFIFSHWYAYILFPKPICLRFMLFTCLPTIVDGYLCPQKLPNFFPATLALLLCYIPLLFWDMWYCCSQDRKPYSAFLCMSTLHETCQNVFEFTTIVIQLTTVIW